ncbi:thioredoxin domain-containing protein [Anaeromyxobacter paludicola]|uniref:Oxidoreductase n=1 Tax=Anaeromyxobacter paludicola TaxID=2918171 RepID=A0ABM7XBH2_9BACT|nr:thioredoxin domain-containing protein [Anaeromyxobacter paludicola]BDG09206.1 oxidoreductase [Anaeromyxobacter paludicola]
MRALFAVLALSAACQSPAKTPAATAPAKTVQSTGQPELDPKAPVAKWNGTTVTAGDLQELVKPEERRMEAEHQEQLYKLRKAGLDSIVNKKLVEEKAKAAGMAPEEFLRKELSSQLTPPTEAELKKVYDQAKAAGQALPEFAQVKPQIEQYLMQQKQQEVLKRYYDKLRADAKVEVLLPPYKPARVEVAAVGPSKGPQGAPITIVEFSDYQCPYCSKAEGTVKQVLAEYGDKVRLVYRDYPLPFHDKAQKAAEAANCAADQGKYWEMHDKLFGQQESLDVAALKKAAGELKLDQGKFDKCLDSGEKAKEVAESKKAGEQAGVSGTPAFFVNGMLLSGALPYESFKTIIDSELKAK